MILHSWTIGSRETRSLTAQKLALLIIYLLLPLLSLFILFYFFFNLSLSSRHTLTLAADATCLWRTPVVNAVSLLSWCDTASQQPGPLCSVSPPGDVPVLPSLCVRCPWATKGGQRSPLVGIACWPVRRVLWLDHIWRCCSPEEGGCEVGPCFGTVVVSSRLKLPKRWFTTSEEVCRKAKLGVCCPL